jgi:hypothetical protein
MMTWRKRQALEERHQDAARSALIHEICHAVVARALCGPL